MLGDALERHLGTAVTLGPGIGGGSISNVRRARLGDGRDVVVKHHPDAPKGMFAAEAAGLRWLGEVADGPRVPEVLAVSDGSPAYIVLEHIPHGPSGGDGGSIGRALAAMHRAGASSFGWPQQTLLATIAQDNTPAGSWATFVADRRLRPFARLARDHGHLDPPLVRGIERLAELAVDLAGPPEPPARLHGDLWSGNLFCDRDGRPVVIDPAVYGGHREVDLAMARLFGGVPARVFDDYHAVFPLAAGHEDRVAFNQVIPLLAHVILFGRAYVEQLRTAVGRYVRVR